MAKDFSNVNTESVYKTIQEATAEPETQEAQEVQQPRKDRKTYTDAEAQEAMQQARTSGRKGVKMPRINLAFYPDTYDYIKCMSRATGTTLTEFVNLALRKHMEDNPDIYQDARKLLERLQ